MPDTNDGGSTRADGRETNTTGADHGLVLDVAWNWPAEPDVLLSLTELFVMTTASSSGAPSSGDRIDPIALKQRLDAASGRIVRTLHFNGDQGIETSFWIDRIGQRYVLRLSSEPQRVLPRNVVDLAEFRRTRRAPGHRGAGPYAA